MDIYTHITFGSGEEAMWITPWYEDEDLKDINPYPELERAVNYYNGNGEWAVRMEYIVKNNTVREGIITFVTKLYKCLAILLDCDEKDIYIFVESKRHSLEIRAEKKEETKMEAGAFVIPNSKEVFRSLANKLKEEETKMENKTYNVACFVIPNAAGYCSQFWLKSVGERVEKYSKALCSQKGIEFDPEHDKVVQVWFTSKYNEDLKNDYLKEDNLGSGDMSSHGFRMDGKFYYFKYSYLPYPLIKDVKEGDTMDLEMEVATEDENDNRTYETIKLHITFDQRSYRYRNFGNFEDVVRKVV